MRYPPRISVQATTNPQGMYETVGVIVSFLRGSWKDLKGCVDKIDLAIRESLDKYAMIYEECILNGGTGFIQSKECRSEILHVSLCL